MQERVTGSMYCKRYTCVVCETYYSKLSKATEHAAKCHSLDKQFLIKVTEESVGSDQENWGQNQKECEVMNNIGRKRKARKEHERVKAIYKPDKQPLSESEYGQKRVKKYVVVDQSLVEVSETDADKDSQSVGAVQDNVIDREPITSCDTHISIDVSSMRSDIPGVSSTEIHTADVIDLDSDDSSAEATCGTNDGVVCYEGETGPVQPMLIVVNTHNENLPNSHTTIDCGSDSEDKIPSWADISTEEYAYSGDENSCVEVCVNHKATKSDKKTTAPVKRKTGPNKTKIPQARKR